MMKFQTKYKIIQQTSGIIKINQKHSSWDQG